MKNFLALLALASSVTAAAVQKRVDVLFDDNFDDLATSIVTPQLYPVGTYNGLAYKGVVVLRPIPGIASVLPHSPAQLAGAAGPIDLLQLGAVTLNTFATIKPATGVKSFDLESFYFGFGTDTGTTAGLAQPGTLSVVAYTVTGQQLTTTYRFSPAGPINQPLVFAALPITFNNLQNVTFAVANSEPITERTYLALDNVRHINHL